MKPLIDQSTIEFIIVRDGIELETHIYLPEGRGPFPAAYSRTVYDLESLHPRKDSLLGKSMAVILQYARGHGKSGGKLEEALPIAEDGYDTISWIISQSWSDGQVATFGRSALAKNQINLGALRHPAHKVMLLSVPSWGIMEGLGGAWFYSQVLMWIYKTQNGPYNQPLDSIDWKSHYEKLPVTSAMDDLGSAQEYYKKVITSDFSSWNPRTGLQSIPHMDIPSLIFTGWWDHCQYGAIAFYEHLRKYGSKRQQKNTHLLVGPWHHSLKNTLNYDFGEAAAYDLTELENRFLDKHLKEDSQHSFSQVQVFVLGENQWRSFSDWPIPEAKSEKLFLHENNLLSFEEPQSENAHSSFQYDPANPVPTVGGANNHPAIKHLPMGGGPYNQFEVCKRKDVAIFKTQPIQQKLTLIGPLEIVLFIKSSALDTDFTAKLMLINQDGFDWMHLSDGIVRTRYRTGRNTPTFLEAGKATELQLDLWNIAVTVLPGYSLALAISSSNFPRFNRNLNTGENNECDDHWNVAEQKILHNSKFQSYLKIQVIDN
jgi:uncharacterized protein